MPLILIVVAVLLLIGAGIALILYLHSRKILREQKNFERGLKMVPMLIHLPPQSTDIEGSGRDERDINDETISQAQTVYSIIASTVQKGFKSGFYGQRHFAFEIVGTKGLIQFRAAVPVVMLEVVQQAITSAYPTARMEEVAEHNVFSQLGKASGTMGGELMLKEDYALPIATFRELKRDPLQSLLNALSTLENEDGAGIQILIRPANSTWRKNALAKADKKRKGKDKKTSKSTTMTGWFTGAFSALWKPPEEKEKKAGDEKPLSGTDQSIVDAIEEKASHQGFEVLIRVIASSNVSQRAHSIVNSINASFALYDSPGRNGFKFAPAKDIDSFITAYILRFFPPEHNMSILNSVELATLFHFPSQRSIPTTQLERQASKQVDGPRNIPDVGMLLGYNVFRGTKKKINLDPNDRRRHLYVVGQTGTGKSTFLENSAVQDMLSGDGFAFIDPHGDTAEKLLSMVPKERTEDVVYFSPADVEYPLGLNMFEFDPERPEQKDFLIQESLSMLYKLYDPQKQGIIGPRFERIFTNAALLLMADPQGGTFVDIPKLLIDADFMKEKLQYVEDQNVLDFWTKEWPNSQRSNEAGEVTSWVVSKFGAFLSNEMMRNIIGQTKSSFNMREIMDNKKILLVNLSKGRTGEMNSKLLGMIFVMKFQAAAMSRADMDEADRVDFGLYVDEFQNYSTDSFADILSEARKFGLNLIVANQFTTQLTDEIRDAIFGNVGSIVSFRVGTSDADFLAKQFAPSFDAEDLQRIPNFNTAVRMLIGGVPTQPFSMATLPPIGTPNKELGEALKQLSAAKHGRPRSIVGKEIYDRITVKEKAPGSKTGAKVAGGQASATAPKKSSTGSSFLDDWLDKKQTNNFKAPASPFKDASQPVQASSSQTPQGVAPIAQNPVHTTQALPAIDPQPAPPPKAPQPASIQQPIFTQPQSLQQPAPVHMDTVPQQPVKIPPVAPMRVPAPQTQQPIQQQAHVTTEHVPQPAVVEPNHMLPDHATPSSPATFANVQPQSLQQPVQSDSGDLPADGNHDQTIRLR